jgi:hypothetical protein
MLELPFTGSRLLRDLLNQGGFVVDRSSLGARVVREATTASRSTALCHRAVVLAPIGFGRPSIDA